MKSVVNIEDENKSDSPSSTSSEDENNKRVKNDKYSDKSLKSTIP